MRILCLVMVLAILVPNLYSQDQGIYRAYPNPYFQHIVEEIEKFEKKTEASDKPFRVDFTGKKYPTDMALYTQMWHNPTISQGNSGTCWAFSTTSFYESEIFRLSGKQVKLSEMYTVYWETVEKARRFVQERGNSVFDQGAQSSSLRRIWSKYGIVPAEAYPGMKPGQPFINHDPMFVEMKKYLESVKAANLWNEEQVLETIQAILHHYIGKPPTTVVVDGKTLTPQEYLASLPIHLDEYLELISLMNHPYYTLVEYPVPDNWWHGADSFNVPLDEFMKVMKYSVRNGFTVVLGGDVSEPGYDSGAKVAIVPSFDIPSNAIDENARTFRFFTQATTDDHGIHCVGWSECEGKDWYLIKDSGSGSRNIEPKGYYFYHEDYVKLKMMNILVHRDAALELWQKHPEFGKKKE